MDYFEQDESVPRAARQTFKWLQEEVQTLLRNYWTSKIYLVLIVPRRSHPANEE